MKKLLGIIAVVLAIATSAFTVNHKSSQVIGNSYTYDLYGDPDQDLPINMDNPENYTFVSTSSLSCSGTSHRCGVEEATDDGFGKPDFTKHFLPIDRD